MKTINVFMCVRNNEDTLDKTFELLDAIVQEHPNFSFRFYVYENDSTDSTKTIVVNFFKTHNGTCLFETLDKHEWGSSKDTQRVVDMSMYRNKMKKLCTQYEHSEFSVILDTNVTFETTILIDMIKIFNAKENIHMITPFGYVKGKPDTYYDTFALDMHSNFEMKSNLNTLLNELKYNSIVKLKSGFAGFVMIRTQTLKKCNWKYSDLCSEHNNFCKEVSMYGDVVCASNIKVAWEL